MQKHEMDFDCSELPTPCYVVDEARLIQNLEILKGVKQRTGCKILLAQKAFSMFRVYPLIAAYLDGATASGLNEARLGFEEMGKENHVFSPAYREDEFDQMTEFCDHIVFNSPAQVKKFGPRALAQGKEIGLRINPEYSTQDHAIYDPCSPGSRLGTTLAQLQKALDESLLSDELFRSISGLHFHTLCEQDSDALEQTLDVVLEKFEPYLKQMKWLNFGGGHHITREGYDIARLERCILRAKKAFGLQVYLEPGEAVALNAGFLVSEVLDTLENGQNLAILDTSAACHMPDVLEMPYRPHIVGSAEAGEKPYSYRLGGPTCLAGDIIGDYSFDAPLNTGSRLVFCDMAIYSMVKNNTFNGMNLPEILLRKTDGTIETVRRFGYKDFKMRLS